jgi:hypothetical protein
MSLEYYINLKNMYQQVINNLDDIINNYYNLLKISQNAITQNFTEDIRFTNINNILNECIFFEKKIFNYTQERKYIICKKEECEKYIYELCEHEFVVDFIDIGLEKTKNITYCKICEYTKK